MRVIRVDGFRYLSLLQRMRDVAGYIFPVGTQNGAKMQTMVVNRSHAARGVGEYPPHCGIQIGGAMSPARKQNRVVQKDDAIRLWKSVAVALVGSLRREMPRTAHGSYLCKGVAPTGQVRGVPRW